MSVISKTLNLSLLIQAFLSSSTPSSLLCSSCEELCSDPPAHLSKLCCGGSGRSLWCGDWCPHPLEHQCEYFFQLYTHHMPAHKIHYLVELREKGGVQRIIKLVKYVVEPLHSPCRTLCCWATSTQAAVMWLAPSGSRSVSSLTRVSTGSSPTRPTLQCQTLTALTTGRLTQTLACTHTYTDS